MAEAAENRLKQEQSRGIKNVESVKRAQEKSQNLERLEREQAPGETTLKWTQN
jgi:small VCP/p97-interacting protein